MLGKTTLSAIRALLYLTQQQSPACLSPRHIAAALGESPTYLAKVLRHLVKAGVLRAERGATGGVRLAMAPEDVTLLDVVEACQGTIVGDYCQATVADASVCSFHRATRDLHEAITGVLSKWTLAALLATPQRNAEMGLPCLMGDAAHRAAALVLPRGARPLPQARP
ncbi:MAG: Rrf2 family transcriptional regulator [Acidobacteria bacterium]|nr:Rrf2 family transcriptional regulator [Acidobacteriota bacterium]